MAIRVLVADDSATVRGEVARWLAHEPGIELAATAINGRQAAERAASRHPDVVLLDVDMPEVDGLEALRRIRADDPTVPVIMFSSNTPRGGVVTLEALSLGASDYVLKPGEGSTPDAVRAQLVEKIRRLHERRVPVRVAPTAPRLRPVAPHRVDVLAIGCSTGGPNVLETIFRELPADLPFPILVVQHMPPLFTKSLAERLTRISKLRVAEAAEGSLPRPGGAWIAPGDRHLVARRHGREVELRLNQDPPVNSCRPSVDILFRSVAAAYGSNALALVLTGMGYDGLAGARELCAAGGEVLAQDEPSSVVWGMPGAVVNAGLASRVLPASAIAAEILARAGGR